MFDASWGEIAVLTTVSLVLIGRKDLPYASNFLGRQVGRMVGLLQGARMRVDRLATDSELKKLQDEFRSGLRELDAVKAEMAGSLVASRSLGGMVNEMGSGRNRMGGMGMSGVGSSPIGKTGSMAAVGAGMAGAVSSSSLPSATSSSPTENLDIGAQYLAAAQQAESQSQSSIQSNLSNAPLHSLAPRSRSVAAVAEEEWEKQGIGFRSIAEQRGVAGGLGEMDRFGSRNMAPSIGGGAALLSDYMRHSLIHDQYERTIREQDEALRTRVEKVRRERYSSEDKRRSSDEKKSKNSGT